MVQARHRARRIERLGDDLDRSGNAPRANAELSVRDVGRLGVIVVEAPAPSGSFHVVGVVDVVSARWAGGDAFDTADPLARRTDLVTNDAVAR
jgi:hypothetical protein